jgi:tRNA threonylcarbamoyladenosine biosynthesis protein TsaE
MSRVKYTVITQSDAETIALGQKLGACLEAGDMVALIGELGSGKTWFTKGLALGLGVNPKTVVTSPSFTLVNEYTGKVPFYHIDVYRLGSLSEFLSAGLEEFFHQKGVCALEWAERWPEILPEHRITVELTILDDHRREITLSGHRSRANKIIHAVRKETTSPLVGSSSCKEGNAVGDK